MAGIGPVRTVAVAGRRTKRFALHGLCLPIIALVGVISPSFGDSTAEQFRADDWVTECSPHRPAADCSIIVRFAQRSDRGAAGSFALAVDLDSGVVAIVGEPSPLTGRLQIDKNLPIHCTGPRYCLFPIDASAAARKELAAGSIALVDVATKGGIFRSSLSAKGYRAGVAKIRAWDYPEVTLDGRRR